jgi:hypothetical protein
MIIISSISIDYFRVKIFKDTLSEKILDYEGCTMLSIILAITIFFSSGLIAMQLIHVFNNVSGKSYIL